MEGGKKLGDISQVGRHHEQLSSTCLPLWVKRVLYVATLVLIILLLVPFLQDSGFSQLSRCVRACVCALAEEDVNNAMDHWKGIYRKAKWLKINAEVCHQPSTSPSISPSIYTHFIFFLYVFWSEDMSGSATHLLCTPLSNALVAGTNIS